MGAGGEGGRGEGREVVGGGQILQLYFFQRFKTSQREVCKVNSIAKKITGDYAPLLAVLFVSFAFLLITEL